MDVKVTKEGKDTIVVEFDGARHTIPNLLRNNLWDDTSVTLAAYEKKHPYLGNPKLIIKSKNPKKSLLDAIKLSQAQIKDFEKEFLKAVKKS